MSKLTPSIRLIVIVSIIALVAGSAAARFGYLESVSALMASPEPTPEAAAAMRDARIKAVPDQDEQTAEVTSSDAPSAPDAANNYTFTTSTTGSFTDMSSGTTQLVAAGTDDGASSVTTLPFDFYFLGVRYNQFSASSNGYMRLGGTGVSTTQYVLGTASAPLITAMGSDLIVSTTGKVHYKVTGVAPNRILTVEWKNMTVIYDGVGTSADCTYQVRLNETTGVIELVYGAMNRNAGTGFGGANNAQYMGFSFNSTANTFAAIDTNNAEVTTGTVTANQFPLSTPMASLNSPGADGTRRIYTFTPATPTAPTGLNFTGVTAVAETLNWTDSPDESLYAIYRSTDGVNYTFVNTAAQNATAFNATGLNPNTTYFWQVYAISDGAFGSALAGSQATATPGAISCNGAGGNWSSIGTWSTNVLPTASDNVTIQNGCTVTIDVTTAVALNVNVQNGGILQYISTIASTLTLSQGAVVDPGGIFQTAATGTVTTHSLVVGTDLTNNGLLNFSTNTNTAGATITFTGAANNTFGGTGGTTNIRTITINKGTSSGNILELNPTNFTVQSVSTDVAGFVTLTNGTLKVSGTFAGTNRVFTAAGYTIPATGGFWLNNPNYVVAGQAGSPTESGLLRITQGTFNIGTGTGNSMGFSTGSTIIVEGGTINAASRFGVATAGNTITYTQSAGAITVCTVANTSATLGSFDLGTSSASSINVTGGTITVQLSATAIDYRMQSGGGVTSLTGGSLFFGNASSGVAKTFNVRGVLPLNTTVTNTSAGHTATMSTTLLTYNNLGQNITIQSGATFNIGNVIFLEAASVVNNGTLSYTAGTSSNFYWFGNGVASTYSGTGVTTAPTVAQSLSFDNPLGVTFNGANQVLTNRVILFSGSVTNANKITLGTGGTSTATTQIGNTTTPTACGTFDQPLTFNVGSGGQPISYLRCTASRSTGGEVNPTRTLTNFTYDDNDPTHTLTIAGGDLTGTGTTTLTNGRVITGVNKYIVGSAGTIARTAGYFDGNEQQTYSAIGSKTFDVGTANGYSPVAINATAITATPSMVVKATQGSMPALTGSNNKLARYWTLTPAGSLTADLTFTYLPTDITGTIANYQIVKNSAGAISTFVPTSGPTTTSAGLTGVSSFSDWTLAEISATQATLTYDGNGNTGGSAPSAVTQTINTTTAVSSNTGSLVKTGFVFGGWNTANDGSGTAYAVGSTFTFTANTTLFARWLTSCNPGFYNNGTGCVAADPGNYVPNAGATSQIPCAPGTYQSQSASTSCNPAPSGTFVPNSGATSPTPCAAGTSSGPGATACTAIPTQATGITFSNITSNSMTVSWTNGNGTGRVVNINQSNSFNVPPNGNGPTANSVYGGAGEQVVYNGNGTSVNVTNLAQATTYYFHVFESNGSDPQTVYQSADAANNPNSQTTAGPIEQFSASGFTGNESENGVVTITRSGDTSGASSVQFSTVAGGTATGGASCGGSVDYVTVTNQLVSFAANDTSKTVNVQLCPDNSYESQETVNLTLSGPVNSTLGPQSTATLTINDTASPYRNANEIDVALGSPGSIYPSQLTVSGAPTTIGGMRVTLYDVSHTFPDNFEVLLVDPSGTKTYVLMASAGGPNSIDPANPVTLTFNDNATQVLPDSTVLTTGQFKPTTWTTVSSFQAPAPPNSGATTYTLPGSTLSRPANQTMVGRFTGVNPNGTWSLYVRDDNGSPFTEQIVGMVAGGWGLQFLSPTAAGVNVGGRVLTPEGAGLRNARVVMTDSHGNTQTVMTNAFGYYTFQNITSGETYLVGVSSRNYTYATRVVQVFDTLVDVDFMPQ